MDVSGRIATRGDQVIALTGLEFDLLEYLLLNSGSVVSREMVARDVWKTTLRYTSMDNVIDVHIARIRRKIDDCLLYTSFAIACIYAVRIQPGVRAQWASHGIALACLVGLFAIAAGTLTALPEKSRNALPFSLGLLLFVVGISGTALIVFPEIVPFSVSLWDASSSSTSQRLVMIGAACVTPVVLAYSAFAYWIFRGKTPEDGWEA